jgi:DNA polymerase III epsilon subunit family exonuclease
MLEENKNFSQRLTRFQEETFVIFDTETTGLFYNSGDEIVEIAAEKIQGGKVIGEFYSLINPAVPVTEGAYLVHGLSDKFLAQNGNQAAEVMPRFCDFSRESILVGHNIMSFDLGFINRHLERLGLPALDNLAIDTLIMARKLLPVLPNHKLTTLAEHFKINVQGAHRAKKDVQMNKMVFLKMLELYLNKTREDLHIVK